MKLGVFAVLLSKMPLVEALTYIKSLDCEAVEIGCGGYPGKAHCNPAELLADPAAFDRFRDTINNSGLTISGLSAHGNPVHPDKAKAKEYDRDFRDAVLLAEKLGVDTVVCFSGCPGDHDDAKYPNWVTCAWPPDYMAILEYQWSEVLIPYWKEAVAFANAHGVKKIALEMHPGFAVYNPSTLLSLREAVGDTPAPFLLSMRTAL